MNNLDRIIVGTALHLDEAVPLHHIQRGMRQVRTDAGHEALPLGVEVKGITDVQGLPHPEISRPEETSAPDHRHRELEGVHDLPYERGHLHLSGETLPLTSVEHVPLHP